MSSKLVYTIAARSVVKLAHGYLSLLQLRVNLGLFPNSALLTANAIKITYNSDEFTCTDNSKIVEVCTVLS